MADFLGRSLQIENDNFEISVMIIENKAHIRQQLLSYWISHQ